MDIRKILDIITEAEKPFAKGMKVMTLAQFLDSEGVEPPADMDNLDEAEKLQGVSKRVLSKDELISYLDRIIGKTKSKTEKYKLPYIHSSNVPIVNEEGQKYDLEQLAQLFSKRPEKILKQNEKMQHSDGSASQFYNVGLPALKGLAIDEDKNEFIVIDTCPGAGQCKLVCYAMKGGYVQWKASSLGHPSRCKAATRTAP